MLLTPYGATFIIEKKSGETVCQTPMYEAFYGFQENPFRLTPDPRYLFLSANHQEALGHLLFGVNEGSGVVVLTGEIGAGKTTLLRTLVSDLDASTTLAYLFNPALSDVELLQAINADLGLPADSTSKRELTDELNRFLLAQQAAGRRVVVIIDEAQNLAAPVLEQLRLLSNLETEQEKLLHIILAGQPELREILARPELAQLDQRVTIRWHLGPLDVKDTSAYVRHRLSVAADGREVRLFPSAALRQVYRFSRGIPRLINILCHRALLVGYTQGEARIRTRTIRQAIKELHRHTTRSPGFRRSPATAAVALVIGGSLLAWGSFDIPAAWNRLDMWASRGREEASRSLPADTSPVPETRLGTSQEAQKGEETLLSTLEPQTVDLAVATSPLQELFHALQREERLASAVRATRALIATWQDAPLEEIEWRDGKLDLAAIASARQLEYLPVRSDIRLLTLLDLPVMIGLTVPPSQQTRFALIRQVTDTHCRIRLERDYVVPLEAIMQRWFREAHIFWKNYEEIRITLALGSRGPAVEKVQTLLASVPTPSHMGALLVHQAGAPTPFFGPQTQGAVAQFQKMQHLVPDGIVGPQTLILLYRRLPEYTPPSLSRGERREGAATAQLPTGVQQGPSLSPRQERAGPTGQPEPTGRDA